MHTDIYIYIPISYIYVPHVYLHECVIFTVSVATYTIHGSYGIWPLDDI